MNQRFDRFTERARRVLTLAQEEAARLNHDDIGTEHLLLGLIREQDGVGAHVLAEAGVDVERVRTALETVHARGDRPPTGQTGLTERAKKVIERSVSEAQRLGHQHIGTEHLLLGLVNQDSGGAIDVLTLLGVNLEQLRGVTIQMLAQHQAPHSPDEEATERDAARASSSALGGEPVNIRNPSFTDHARQVLTLAQEEAAHSNHNYIGTEHLLLGLVRLPDCGAAKVLANLGVDLNQVRSAVEFVVGRGQRPVLGEIGLTPRSKRVIDLAVDEVRRLDQSAIGTEHLLIGLVREGEGIAAGVLQSMGVSLESARREVLQQLGQVGSQPNAQPRVWPPPVPPEAAALVGSGEPAQTCVRCTARNPLYFRYCFNCGAQLMTA